MLNFDEMEYFNEFRLDVISIFLNENYLPQEHKIGYLFYHYTHFIIII
jgi:hypothetical protein